MRRFVGPLSNRAGSVAANVARNTPVANLTAASCKMAPRFMSARVPIPKPEWKQQEDIENKMASSMDMATGLERAEMLANLEGRNIFDEHPIGPFGTVENPYIVESLYDERIVGCPCDGETEASRTDTRAMNEVKWFMVKAGQECRCPACQQVFKLQKVEGEGYNF